MRILIITPDPATEVKPRVFRLALVLAKLHDVHIVSIDELPGRSVSPQIKTRGQQQLQNHNIIIHQIRDQWHHASLEICRSIFKGFPLRVALYQTSTLRRQVHDLVAAVDPDVIHVDRKRVYGLVENLGRRIVVDLTDPIGWYYGERARLTMFPLALYYSIESRRLWRYEAHIGMSGRPILFASEFGAAIYKAKVPTANVFVVPVPLPIINSQPEPAILPGTAPRICFIGNLYYAPNVMGITDFVRTCWDTILSRLPTATLHIAGSRPSKAVQQLTKYSSVYVHRNVEDMISLLRACDISIAPIPICAGFPNKIVDSIIGGDLPVVASAEAIVGLPYALNRYLPVASTADQWTNQLCELWQDRRKSQYMVKEMKVRLASAINNDHILRTLTSLYNNCG